MAKKLTQKEFILKAQKIHGKEHYDYSKVNYVNNTTNVSIFCNIHKKSFLQSPKSHCKGHGCHLCGREKQINLSREDKTLFIEKAIKKHGTNYDYSKVIYINSKTKIEIFCKTHNILFKQTPNSHLLGNGCKLCGIEKRAKSQTLTTFTFIEKAKLVHGESTYDYSKTIYTNSKKEVDIICPIHKSFFVTPNDHLSKKVGCQTCGRDRTTKAVQERYKDVGKIHLINAKKVHNNIYDYSKVVYTGCENKVTIRCLKHGDFEMLLDNHATQKQGCPKCGKESMAKIRSLKLDNFITRSIETHNNLYSYDNVTENTLKNGSSIVEIYCKKCKKYFSQQAKIHIAGSGCTICYREQSAIDRALTTEEFIARSQKVHVITKYDYSMTEYINNREKVKIKCNDCNYVFETIPSDHIGKASGCPKCANLISNPEKEIVEFIKSLNIVVKECTREIIQNPNNGRKWELDIFLPEHNIAIEFNGIYFHSTARKSNINFHKEKTDACLEKGIFLLHIFEDDFNYKKHIVYNRIRELTNKPKTLPILSENTKLKVINSSLANNFLDQNHIHGNTKATFYYGLFYNNELVAVSAFLKGNNNTRNENMYELVRHSTKGMVIDFLSKVIKKFQRNFTESLYVYCDNSFFNTEFYTKVGFKKVEDIPPGYKYVINSKRENKSKWKKTDIKSKLPNFYCEDKSIEEIMLDANIYKIYDSGKTRLEL